MRRTGRPAPEVTRYARIARMRQSLCSIACNRGCGRSFAKTRIGDREQVHRIRPPSASPARREMLPTLRSTTARPATRTRADPAAPAISTGARRGSPKRTVRRGRGCRPFASRSSPAISRPGAFGGARPCLASTRPPANAPGCSSALAKTPARGSIPDVADSGQRMPLWRQRSRWGPRSTGTSAPAVTPRSTSPDGWAATI